MSKILYMSCHSVLEFDEVKLLHELGHEVFSPGAYVEPLNPGDASLRPAIQLKYNQDIIDQWHQLASLYPGKDAKDYLTKSFVDNFEIILVMHLPRWISNNWDVIKHKRVIWRTIGQSVTSTEKSLERYRAQGLEIVRYSPAEATIPGFIGQDALIRFYKDPTDYGPWNGQNRRVINFTQHMKQRGAACGWEPFNKVTAPFPRHLFGPGNGGMDWSTDKVPYEQLQQELRDNRVYFYTGTHPASYTLNFMEAWMTGIPIVALGPQSGNSPNFPGHKLYEVPSLITQGEDGYCSDTLEELQYVIKLLLEDDGLAQRMSVAGRQSAIKHFGKEMIAASWKKYLGE